MSSGDRYDDRLADDRSLVEMIMQRGMDELRCDPELGLADVFRRAADMWPDSSAAPPVAAGQPPARPLDVEGGPAATTFTDRASSAYRSPRPDGSATGQTLVMLVVLLVSLPFLPFVLLVVAVVRLRDRLAGRQSLLAGLDRDPHAVRGEPGSL